MISEKDIADALNDDEALHKGKCPHCSAPFSVPARWVGKKAKCKKCDKTFSVPYPVSAPMASSSCSRPQAASILRPGVVAEKRETSAKNELTWGQKLNIAIVIFLVLNTAAVVAAGFEVINLESLVWISPMLWSVFLVFLVYACASFGRAVTGYLKRIAESSEKP